MLLNTNFQLAEMFYKKKCLLEKAAMMKRFEHLSLGKELKAQTDNAKKHYIYIYIYIYMIKLQNYIMTWYKSILIKI